MDSEQPVFVAARLSSLHSLLLYLFEAERLYAYAQELYAADEHHKAIAKHRRSLSWAARLTALCLQLSQADFPVAALFEVFTYSRIISGRLALKKDDFSAALSSLCAAHHLLDVLTRSSPSTRDQALASVFIDEISPEIRYCAHELKTNRSHDVQRIVNAIGPRECELTIEGFIELSNTLSTNAGSAAPQVEHIPNKLWTWDGKIVPIRNPELVDVLERVQNAEQRLANQDRLGNKARMTAFDAILQSWSEAQEVSKRITEMQKETTVACTIPDTDI